VFRFETRDIALIGLFAALTAVGAFIRIPLPYVPITMQVFFVLFAGLLLGARAGALSQLVYILIGLAGLPVFAEGGGPGYVFHPSFGFLVGFVAAAWVMGFLSFKPGRDVNRLRIVLSSLAALVVIYLIGIPYLYLAINYFLLQEISLVNAFKVGLVFLPGDIIKVGVLAFIGPAVVKSIRSASF